jgi:hypothetical protein
MHLRNTRQAGKMLAVDAGKVVCVLRHDLKQVVCRSGHEVTFQHVRLPSDRRPDGTRHGFDPRNTKPSIGRIGVAGGRDAADVSLSQCFEPHVPVRLGVWADEVSLGVSGLGEKPLFRVVALCPRSREKTAKLAVNFICT